MGRRVGEGFAADAVNQRGTMLSPPFATVGVSNNVLFPDASGIAYATYLGPSPVAIATATVRVEVTAAPTGVLTWAEVAIARGTPQSDAGPADMEVLGYTDVSAWLGAAAEAKDVSVDMSAHPVAAGDELWVIVSICSDTTSGGLRAFGPAESVGSGIGAWSTAAAEQPSTLLGTPGALGSVAAQQLFATIEKVT